jgi:hypothetical protein
MYATSTKKKRVRKRTFWGKKRVKTGNRWKHCCLWNYINWPEENTETARSRRLDRSLTFKRSLPESSSRCMAFCIIPDLCRKVPRRALIVQSVMDTLSTRCMHSSHAKMDPRTSLLRIACSLRFRPTFCDDDEADLNDAAGDLLLLLLLLLLARASSSSSCSSCSRSGVALVDELSVTQREKGGGFVGALQVIWIHMSIK